MQQKHMGPQVHWSSNLLQWANEFHQQISVHKSAFQNQRYCHPVSNFGFVHGNLRATPQKIEDYSGTMMVNNPQIPIICVRLQQWWFRLLIKSSFAAIEWPVRNAGLVQDERSAWHVVVKYPSVWRWPRQGPLTANGEGTHTWMTVMPPGGTARLPSTIGVIVSRCTGER